eukprot:11143873-Prorocentrum_lima.AAC.1
MVELQANSRLASLEDLPCLLQDDEELCCLQRRPPQLHAWEHFLQVHGEAAADAPRQEASARRAVAKMANGGLVEQK